MNYYYLPYQEAENSMQMPYNKATCQSIMEKLNMCEFNVIFNGKTQFKDVVYAKIDGKNVIVKNVLGETKEFKNCVITEVDVNSTRLILTPNS
jgi:predicted RNA-binding protein